MSAFGGESGHDLVRCTCLLLTQSGHNPQLPISQFEPLGWSLTGGGGARDVISIIDG
jgi:hypothetical protein